MVQIHCYSVRDGGGAGGYLFSRVVMDDVVVGQAGAQPPGLIVSSKYGVFILSFPADSPVAHSYIN